MSEFLLIYDKQCPFCDRYARRVRIRASVGELRLVDAREGGAVMGEVTAAGLDIDRGMLLKMGERLYYGPEAMQVLALLSTRSGSFNRLNYWLFRSKRVSGLLYPLLRACRNLALRLLGRTRIDNLHLTDKDRF